MALPTMFGSAVLFGGASATAEPEPGRSAAVNAAAATTGTATRSSSRVRRLDVLVSVGCMTPPWYVPCYPRYRVSSRPDAFFAGFFPRANDSLMSDVREAQFEETPRGLVPKGEGWFVVNARDVTWVQSEERGQDTDFEGRQEWTQLGFRIQVLSPGQRGLYHGESGQEDFLVVAGECILVLEGEERLL